MILSKDDAKLFFELWLPLLDFVNTEYQVCTDLKMQPYTHEHYEQSPPGKNMITAMNGVFSVKC